ncbi:hypothetical protein IMSHALPRED_010105 [Imshaugia aleurites]|uniref:F-box domain-containing protein n=1 Tax=Imshaugia aleurites TaxID=172621 RepID=A0A8H3FZD7_9LECA|nr:hypothetical protein IMSHALPRED_010105 [Imshaugia aleurites]
MDDQLPRPPMPVVPPPNPFLSLPPELKQSIFSALPNAGALRSLVLACSSFYRTFLDAESLIIRSVLYTQIGSDLLNDAVIVFQSRALDQHDEEAAIELLKSYTRRDTRCMSQIWRLRDALAIGDLHGDIEFFCRGFAASALSIHPVTGVEETSPSPLSLLESNRIKRTLYRYELFCNIFRKLGMLQDIQATPETPQSIFFSSCAPWENEQLACVRAYILERFSLRACSENLYPLYDKLTISAFCDVAEHDIECGSWEMRGSDGVDGFNDWKEHYLSLGLAYLRQMVNTSAFDDRCHLLKTHKEDPDCSLFDALMIQGDGNDPSHLDTYTEEDEHRYIPPQRAIDSDKGPEEAWRWAYAAYTNQYWYNMSDQMALRQRGYVMWDSIRLAKWGLLDLDELPREPPREPIVTEEQIRRDREISASFEERQRIWNQGGRGWWSAGDESRIVWPPSGPPKPPKPMGPRRSWSNKDVWVADMQTWRMTL